ncbi:hypothetical protein D3C72_1693020 [compost metagenome]
MVEAVNRQAVGVEDDVHVLVNHRVEEVRGPVDGVHVEDLRVVGTHPVALLGEGVREEIQRLDESPVLRGNLLRDQEVETVIAPVVAVRPSRRPFSVLLGDAGERASKFWLRRERSCGLKRN